MAETLETPENPEKPDPLAGYTEACDACQVKGQWVRNGNWLPIAHFFRHADCKAAPVSVVEDSHSTILKVEPVKPEKAPPGKSVAARPAFYLLVR